VIVVETKVRNALRPALVSQLVTLGTVRHELYDKFLLSVLNKIKSGIRPAGLYLLQLISGKILIKDLKKIIPWFETGIELVRLRRHYRAP
jgi:hypothetical protein